MSAFDPLPPPSAIQRALPPGTRVDGIEIGPAVAEDAATVTYRAIGPRGEFLSLTEYMPAQVALRDADGSVLSVDDETFRAGLAAFLEEARVLQRADHPSLIGVLDVVEARGTAFRTSRWIDGTRLVDIRRQMTEPPDEEALRDLLESLLGGLNAWQREGGLHGAVTPANILLLTNDRPVLLGPNKALQAVAGERIAALVTSMEPSFAPIEQIAPTADLPLGLTADYYALAGVIRYCISGQLPPPALGGAGLPPRESMRELARRVRYAWPKLHYGEALLDTLEAALSHLPQQRPQSIAQFRAWLNTGPEGSVAAPVNEPEGTIVRPRGAAAPIPIDPVVPGATPPDPKRVPPRPPRARAARAQPPADDPLASFTTLGSIPGPQADPAAESEPAFSFFGIDPDDHRSDRFDHIDRFDRIEHDVRHTRVTAPPPRPRRRWGWITAATLGVLLVIGAVAGVHEYERRREANRTLEIARDALTVPPEPTAAGPRGAPPAAPPQDTQPQSPQGAATSGTAQPGTTPPGAAAQGNVAQGAAPGTPAPVTAPQGAAPAAVAPNPGQPTPAAPAQPPAQTPAQPAPSPTTPAAVAPQTTPPAQSTVPTVQVPPAGTAAANPPPPANAPPTTNATRQAAAPRPALAPPPESPREVCGPRTQFSLYRCMTQQCALPQWRFHAQCERLRRFDRVD